MAYCLTLPMGIIWYAGSERNMAKLTLDGVDVMGERLAEEVDFLWLWIILCILHVPFLEKYVIG